MNSVAVVFPRPSEGIWPTHNLAVAGDVCHFVASCHQRDTIMADALIADIAADFKKQNLKNKKEEYTPSLLHPVEKYYVEKK